jgi:hypothetical protein
MITYSHLDMNSGEEYAAVRRTADKGVRWAGQQKVSVGQRAAWPGAVARLGLKYRYVYHQCVVDGAEHAHDGDGPPARCDNALFYRETADGLSWSAPIRFSPSAHHDGAVLGIGQTQISGKYWIGWTRVALDAYSGDVFVRGFTP